MVPGAAQESAMTRAAAIVVICEKAATLRTPNCGKKVDAMRVTEGLEMVREHDGGGGGARQREGQYGSSHSIGKKSRKKKEREKERQGKEPVGLGGILTTSRRKGNLSSVQPSSDGDPAFCLFYS
jgi:hypothetical protein